jgi:uncharacterized UBP type Zn finger protein
MSKLTEWFFRLGYRKKRPLDCTHLDQINRHVQPSAEGCEDCLKIGDTWVHLRICMICGHVGCCDNSKNKHASAHYHATGHPIIRSLEKGEDQRSAVSQSGRLSAISGQLSA